MIDYSFEIARIHRELDRYFEQYPDEIDRREDMFWMAMAIVEAGHEVPVISKGSNGSTIYTFWGPDYVPPE